MGRLFWLSDQQWAVIEPLLPRNKGGARRVDDRRVISGIIHVLKVGSRWCDCPADYGPSTTVYNRFKVTARLLPRRFCLDTSDRIWIRQDFKIIQEVSPGGSRTACL